MDSNNEVIFWLGTCFDEKTMLANSAISPAANKWQQQFISAILKNSNYQVICFGHMPERVFPFGRIFINRKKSTLHSEIKGVLTSYLNIPFLRSIFINFSIIIKCLLVISQYGKPKYVISFNVYQYNSLVVLFLKYVLKIKWACILADPMNDKTDKYHPLTNFSDRSVFLSFSEFKNSIKPKKIHIDGGINQYNKVKNHKNYSQEQRFILYTGRISIHNGIDILLDAMNYIDDDVKLIICGKGHNQKLTNLMSSNKSKVIYKGVVEEHELDELMKNASCLLNPRLISSSTNKSIFPSKILEYLSYKKPIVSTKTSGISDEYNSIIEFVYIDSPEAFARKVTEVLSWTVTQQEIRSKKIEQFISTQKSWDIISQRFINWLNE